MANVDDILKKYSRKIESEIQTYNGTGPIRNQGSSKEFEEFKQDMMPELSRYERWAKGLGSIIKIKLSQKDEKKIKKNLENAHLNVNPEEVAGLAIVSFILVLFFSILLSVTIALSSNKDFISAFPFGLFLLMVVSGLFLFYYFYNLPVRLATKWRLKASSQMVPAILYTVIYMKHTSNLERAINFVANHIEAPLSYDLKKILWDVETGKYSSIKESLDVYLNSWKDYSMEFVESFHLIESSLYEPNEARRIEILERSLRVILEGVYDKMLKYTHSIKSPLTNIYMLGIVLPTLGLALVPLASTLMQGMFKSVHMFVFFNLIIPFMVFYLTVNIMLKRVGGYGETSLLEKNPYYYKYKSKKPYITAGAISFLFFLIGILPLLFGYTSLPKILGLNPDFNMKAIHLGFLGNNFFEFVGGNGPFGVGALLLSLFVPFSVGLFFIISFSMRTKELIKARDASKNLEQEFNSSLFTLGNRLGDGFPAEIAFLKVAESVKGQKTEDFFRIVNTNIQSMGMSVEEAIFNPKRGAIVYYPSTLIATSMKILVESVKKGLSVAASSLMSISEYVKNIQKIDQRLKDLLAEVSSDMRSNMTFLAPLLAGIVVGLSAMITGILMKLKLMMSTGMGDKAVLGVGSMGTLVNMFDVAKMVPPYFIQISVGFYIIQIIFILTSTLVVIDAGEDKLRTTYEISKNLKRALMLYLFIAFLSIFVLSLVSSFALGFPV